MSPRLRHPQRSIKSVPWTISLCAGLAFLAGFVVLQGPSKSGDGADSVAPVAEEILRSLPLVPAAATPSTEAGRNRAIGQVAAFLRSAATAPLAQADGNRAIGQLDAPAPAAATFSTLPARLDETELVIRQDAEGSSLFILRAGSEDTLVTVQAKPDHRPFLHPIQAPDGRGTFTEYSPGHHPHQTGLYWGFTRVNGRDYFHHPEGDYWRRVSVDVLTKQGEQVSWRTIYDLLDEEGETVLTETQVWSMVEEDGRYFLDLEWSGEARTDILIGEFDYGGLFLRMPWTRGIAGSAVNAARQRNQAAEGQRAMWLDVGMQVEGRDDMAHVAIFDHPDNKGFPHPWRVDGQLGVGPVRARLGGWMISGGETESIQHRLMFYTGPMNNAEIRNQWERYIGMEGEQYSVVALWDLAQREGRQAEFLTPDRAVDIMTLVDGFKVNSWANEPMITQPMAFAWDDRGRLWVAENRDYETRRIGFSNSGDSRILILEDTDRDGVADSRKVFLEGIPFPSALAVGFGGVYLGAPPHLLFIPDRDGDDVADVDDIEILLTGWGIRDRHEVLNSFHWGPDGWLYGLEGFATPSRVHKPVPGEQVYKQGDPFPEDILEGEGVDIDGGVWRYHPTKDRFEVVAHGFSNPWGIDYDAKGEFFITACVIPHVFHVIQGGIFHRQGGQHFNPYVYSDIRTIAEHRHRSAHGGARVYQSDAFPEEQQGRLFMANIHEHAVLSDILTPRGSGYVATEGQDFMLANNAQWVGFSMEVGPGGDLYVLDWHDGAICGNDVLDKDTGRIFRIAPETSLAEDWEGRYDDLRNFSDMQLAALQTSVSDWHSRRARVILQYRATQRPIDAEAQEALRAQFAAHENPDYRLRGMWSLHVTGLLAGERLLEALADEEEYVRAWAIQLLVEDMDASEAALEQFARMAEMDPAPVVRKYLASALQRMPYENRWAIAEALVGRAEDADDHNIPKMIWFGVEPLVPEDPDRALALAAESSLPLVTTFIARRAVDAEMLEPLVEALSRYGDVRKALLQGMRDGLEGYGDIAAPPGWDALYDMLQEDEEMASLALEIAQIFGDSDAGDALLAALRDETMGMDVRRGALNSLIETRHAGLVAELPVLMKDPDFRVDAIRAVAVFDEESLGAVLMEAYPAFNSMEQRATLETLASRPTYGWMLTEAIQSGAIAREEVPAYVARQLRRVVGSGFVEVWGPIDDGPSDDDEAFAAYRKLLTPEAIAAADPSRGRLLYDRVCAACHVMYDAGGLIGPDLTGSNRTDIEYILSNVLTPSADIQDDYRMTIVTMRDGQTLIGNVSNETERQLTLRIVGRGDVALEKSGIQSREVSANSLMPEGLFRALTDEQVLDIVSYLHASEQVAPPGE